MQELGPLGLELAVYRQAVDQLLQAVQQQQQEHGGSDSAPLEGGESKQALLARGVQRE